MLVVGTARKIEYQSGGGDKCGDAEPLPLHETTPEIDLTSCSDATL